MSREDKAVVGCLFIFALEFFGCYIISWLASQALPLSVGQIMLLAFCAFLFKRFIS